MLRVGLAEEVAAVFGRQRRRQVGVHHAAAATSPPERLIWEVPEVPHVQRQCSSMPSGRLANCSMCSGKSRIRLP